MANQPKKSQTESKRAAEQRGTEKVNYPLGKINFIMMGICLLLIVIGFALMAGSANVGDTFNYSIFESRRVAVGPVIAFFGFVLMAFAIIWRKKPRHDSDADMTDKTIDE